MTQSILPSSEQQAVANHNTNNSSADISPDPWRRKSRKISRDGGVYLSLGGSLGSLRRKLLACPFRHETENGTPGAFLMLLLWPKNETSAGSDATLDDVKHRLFIGVFHISNHSTRRTDYGLGRLDPNLRLWDVVQNWCWSNSGSPRSCRLYSSHPATWPRSYRSGINLPCQAGLDHGVGINYPSDAWNTTRHKNVNLCSDRS